MSSGRPPPKCGRCRSHGKPNIRRKGHECPYKEHGLECEQEGCRLITERSMNDKMAKALKAAKPAEIKRSNDQEDEILRSSFTVNDESNDSSGPTTTPSESKKRSRSPSETDICPKRSSVRLRREQQALVRPHAQYQLPPYCCVYPSQPVCPRFAGPQDLSTFPAFLAREWSHEPYQDPVRGLVPAVQAPPCPSEPFGDFSRLL